MPRHVRDLVVGRVDERGAAACEADVVDVREHVDAEWDGGAPCAGRGKGQDRGERRVQHEARPLVRGDRRRLGCEVGGGATVEREAPEDDLARLELVAHRTAQGGARRGVDAGFAGRAAGVLAVTGVLGRVDGDGWLETFEERGDGGEARVAVKVYDRVLRVEWEIGFDRLWVRFDER